MFSLYLEKSKTKIKIPLSCQRLTFTTISISTFLHLFTIANSKSWTLICSICLRKINHVSLILTKCLHSLFGILCFNSVKIFNHYMACLYPLQLQTDSWCCHSHLFPGGFINYFLLSIKNSLCLPTQKVQQD